MSLFKFGRTFTVLPASAALHSATVIFLHGLGDTGQGWSMGMEEIKDGHIKYLCPTAPTQAVSLNYGFQMPSWFDIRGLEGTPEDEEGINQSSEAVKSLIDREVASGIPYNRIVLGGFSQGGATALFTALTMNTNLAGIAAFSTWLPLHKVFSSSNVTANKETPTLQCHGNADDMVPIKWGKLTASFLKSFNPNCEFKEYKGMGHHSCEAEMMDFKNFLSQVLPSK